MRALVLNGFTGPDATEIAEVPDPHAAADGVLVAVQAAGMGAWDVQTTEGAFGAAGGMTTFPQVLGWDFTGIVADVGADVRDLHVGEAVLGFSPQPWSQKGSFAEYVTVPAAALARRPDSLPLERAAVLPVSALAADLALQACELPRSASVLVLGATGGVGSLVVQLARAAGATVVASVAAAQAATALELGAALSVDRGRPVAAQVLAEHGPVDAVVDLVGPAARDGIADVIKDGGRFVTTVLHGGNPHERGIVVTTVQVMPDGDRLGQLAQLAAAGALRTTIGSVRPFHEATAALADLKNGSTGKTALDVRRG